MISGDGPRGRAARRRRGTTPKRGIAAAAGVLFSTALVAQGGVTSDAAWNDAEWVHGPIGTSDCANPLGMFANRGEGRALSGSLLGVDLDALLEAGGVEVTNDGVRSEESTGTATPLGDDAYANPLNVVALSTVNANLGQGLLQLPLDNSTGVLGQYGQSKTDGVSVGASGYVTDTGAIATAQGDAYPDLATLRISQLVNAISPALTPTLGDVADVELRIGAVAGHAHLDACAEAWGSELANALTREYLASHVRTEFTSPTVAALTGGVSGAVQTLESTVAGLSSNTGVLTEIRTGATSLLNGVLGLGGLGALLGVSLGSVTVNSLSATIDTSAVQTLLQNPITDTGGTIVIDPGSGAISVDTAALLERAYPGAYGTGLNGLPPNSDPLQDPAVAGALAAALAEALNGWIASVNTALGQAVDAIAVNVQLSVIVRLQILGLPVNIARIDATTSGPLSNLTTTTQTEILRSGLLSDVLGLVDSLASALVTGLGGVVQGAVGAVVNGLRALAPAVTALATPVATAVSTLYTRLFMDGLVSLTINAQNDPLPGSPSPGAEPIEWNGLAEGRYEVAALRVGVLDALRPAGVRLYLGRGSVGEVCSQAGVAAGGCASY